jgi:hypothetical protein
MSCYCQINRGPPGPPGIAGAQGPTGPSGSNEAFYANFSGDSRAPLSISFSDLTRVGTATLTYTETGPGGSSNIIVNWTLPTSIVVSQVIQASGLFISTSGVNDVSANRGYVISNNEIVTSFFFSRVVNNGETYVFTIQFTY